MEEDCTEDRVPIFSSGPATSCCSVLTSLTIIPCQRGGSGSFCGPISNPGWSGSSGGTRSSAGEGPWLSHLETSGARERARRTFLRLRADALATGDLSRELALNGLEEVLLLAVREGAGGRPVDPRVRKVLDLISSDLAADYDVPGLAREVALSPSRLSHLFKEEVGEPVMGAVIRLRLNQAARLLEHTVDDIGAIAREVGFGSPYYFSRQFRRHFGMSPRQYRATAGHVRSGSNT